MSRPEWDASSLIIFADAAVVLVEDEIRARAARLEFCAEAVDRCLVVERRVFLRVRDDRERVRRRRGASRRRPESGPEEAA